MTAPELPWNAEALRQQLAVRWPGITLEVVASTGSTNSDLLERVARFAPAGGSQGNAMQALVAEAEYDDDAEPDGDSPRAGVMIRRSVESRAFAARPARFPPVLRVTEMQTAGRGRRGRSWLSTRGASLTFSLAVPIARADWSGLSLALGVALAAAIEPSADRPRIGLKWPNDLLLVDGDAPVLGAGTDAARKLAGILVETAPAGRERVAVIGIGLNVQPIASLGNDAEPFSTGHASVGELIANIDAPRLLALVAPALLDAIDQFEAGGFARFAERYAVRDLLCGRAIRTTQADLPEGIACGVAPDGTLRIERPDGTQDRIASGEVSVRAQAPRAATTC